MKYVVFDHSGYVHQSGLTALEAVKAAATHDGKGFRIAEEGGFFHIETTAYSRNTSGGAGKFQRWDIYGSSAEGVAEKAIQKYREIEGYYIQPLMQAARDKVDMLIEYIEDGDPCPDRAVASLKQLRDILAEGK